MRLAGCSSRLCGKLAGRAFVSHVRHAIRFETSQVQATPLGRVLDGSVAAPHGFLVHTYRSAANSSKNASQEEVHIVSDPEKLEALLSEMLEPKCGAPTDHSSCGKGPVLFWNAQHEVLVEQLKSRLCELAPLKEAKDRIDNYVENRYRHVLYAATAAFLAVQFVILSRWVFVVFDWNLVEPMTYFLGYTTVWLAITLYYRYTCGVVSALQQQPTADRPAAEGGVVAGEGVLERFSDFTWDNMFDYFVQQKKEKMYNNSKFDLSRYVQLELEIHELQNVLKRL